VGRQKKRTVTDLELNRHQLGATAAAPDERAAALWATLDGCERLEGGIVVLEEADQQCLAETAATLWVISREQAARVLRLYLTFYVIGCPWRLLSPVQHQHLVEALQQQEVWARRTGEYVVPEDAAPETCASCGASIAWATTKRGRPMPLSLATVERRGGQRWALAHFADCPQGAGWSRGGGRETQQEASGGAT
jgi:hypothetical protein